MTGLKAPLELRSTLATMKSAKEKGVNMNIWDNDIKAVEEAVEMIEALRATPAQRPSDKDIKRQFAEFLTDLAELTVEDRAAEALRAAREYIAEDNNPKSNRVLQMIRIALDDLPAEGAAGSQEIEQLRSVFEAARGLCMGYDWNNGTAASACGYRRQLLSAVNAISEVPDFENKYRSSGPQQESPAKNCDVPIGSTEQNIKAAEAQLTILDHWAKDGEGTATVTRVLFKNTAFMIRKLIASLRSPAGKATLQQIAAEARRYASHYPRSSDGQNTFVMFAEWVEKLEPLSQPGMVAEFSDAEYVKLANDHLAKCMDEIQACQSETERLRNLDIMHEAAQKLLVAERDALLDKVEELKTCLHDFVFKEAVCDQTIERAKRLVSDGGGK